jgi:predicted transcriptional regulator
VLLRVNSRFKGKTLASRVLLALWQIDEKQFCQRMIGKCIAWTIARQHESVIMHRICNTFWIIMKTTTIPPLRVSPALRKEAENVLEQGETLSSFVLDALNRSIEFRRSRQAFIARGLASADLARDTGKYISADAVINKLTRKLAKAKQRAS